MGSDFAKMGNQKYFLFVTIQFVRYKFYFYLEGGLKMNNKLKLTSLSVISTFMLAACNGGNSTSGNGQQIDADTISPVVGDTSLDFTALGAANGLIAMVTGGAETELGEQAALWLLDEVSGGKFPPSQTNTLLSNINSQLSTIENDLTGINTKLTQIYTTINDYQANNQLLAITTYENQMATYNNVISGYIASQNNFKKIKIKANPTTYIQIPQSELNVAESAFLFQSSTPFESVILQAMTTRNAQNALIAQAGAFSGLDNLGVELSCDNTSKYSISNQNLHQTPNLSLSNRGYCSLIEALNAQLNTFNTTQLTSGQNALYVYSSFSAGLDLVYLKMVNALTQEYAVDQMRAYLGQHANSLVGVPSYVADSGNYQAALQEVTLAYNSRIGYLNTIFSEAKESAFNYITNLTPAVNSTSLQTQCGVTPQNIVSSVPANESMSQASNQYYWDGSSLTVTCSSNNNQLTTTTSVATLCQNASLQVNNGYISCGASINNYAIMQDYKTATTVHKVEGDLPGQLSWINYSNVPNYTAYGSTAWFSQLYSFWSGGTLNVYYDPNYPIISNNLAQANTILQNQLDDNPTNYTTTNVGFNVDVQPFAAIGLTYVGIPVMVSDGSHTFTLGAGAIHNYGSDNQGFMLLGCVPGDSNCKVGNFPNFTSTGNAFQNFNALVFSNGDVITMYNLNNADGNGYHGDYYLKAFYNGTAPGYITSAVTW